MKKTADQIGKLDLLSPQVLVVSDCSAVPDVDDCRVVYYKFLRVIDFTRKVGPDQQRAQDCAHAVDELRELEEGWTRLLPHLDQNHIVRVVPGTDAQTVYENAQIQVPYLCGVGHEDSGQSLQGDQHRQGQLPVYVLVEEANCNV